jgi:UDP-N-acetylglucosamine--N-acetylmuramyl-(pentapeptide) pyrophosphoryl-undecaprenol N-acetylglucosamine transferase
VIGYYVHHQGRGHLARATEIARRLAEPVTVLSSLPRPEETEPFTDWIELEHDEGGVSSPDLNAGGALHFAPLRYAGHTARMGQIARWLERCTPQLMVVDVSVEVTVLCRLLGTPVLVIAQPGDRGDEAHLLGHRLARHILAPWSCQVYRPAHLREFESKCSYVGAFSRFDGRDRRPPPGRRQVLALFGAGGSQVAAAELRAAQRHTPNWTWMVAGGPGSTWCPDVWPQLQDSDVIITHAGQNALAEVAAARRPAVIVPQPRPFDEQVASSRALHQAGVAQVCPRWPAAGQWGRLLETALHGDGSRWSRWNDLHGADRAAEVVSRCSKDE